MTFHLNTVTWIGIGLLAPLWWGMALLLVGFLGDLTAKRRLVSHLFDRLEGGHPQPRGRTDVVSGGLATVPPE